MTGWQLLEKELLIPAITYCLHRLTTTWDSRIKILSTRSGRISASGAVVPNRTTTACVSPTGSHEPRLSFQPRKTLCRRLFLSLSLLRNRSLVTKRVLLLASEFVFESEARAALENQQHLRCAKKEEFTLLMLFCFFYPQFVAGNRRKQWFKTSLKKMRRGPMPRREDSRNAR